MKNKINALRKKVQNKIETSEYRGVKVNGVTCSRADLEMIVFTLDIFLKQGNINGYVIYGSNVKEVIAKAGIVL